MTTQNATDRKWGTIQYVDTREERVLATLPIVQEDGVKNA
jgi:hypothetical protein